MENRWVDVTQGTAVHPRASVVRYYNEIPTFNVCCHGSLVI